jgi:hypothetical protein
VIDTAVGQSCDAASEFTLDFNQTGPQGAAGPQGPQGPAGADGANTVTTPVPETPAGHVTIASASTTSVRAAVPVASFDALSVSLSQQKGSAPEVTVRRNLDSLSSKLMAATVKGTIFATATINVYKPGSTTVGSTLKLTSVQLTHFQTINIQGGAAPVEEITMVGKTLKVSGGGTLLPAIQYQAPKKKGV